MFRLTIVFLLASIGAVITGALVVELFALALIGLAGLFLVGALLLSRMRPLADDEPAPASLGQARALTSAPSARRRSTPGDIGELYRAA
jgi:hypothetical protein